MGRLDQALGDVAVRGRGIDRGIESEAVAVPMGRGGSRGERSSGEDDAGGGSENKLAKHGGLSCFGVFGGCVWPTSWPWVAGPAGKVQSPVYLLKTPLKGILGPPVPSRDARRLQISLILLEPSDPRPRPTHEPDCRRRCKRLRTKF